MSTGSDDRPIPTDMEVTEEMTDAALDVLDRNRFADGYPDLRAENLTRIFLAMLRHAPKKADSPI